MKILRSVAGVVTAIAYTMTNTHDFSHFFVALCLAAMGVIGHVTSNNS
jgi:hypothetical protein